jgi:hypothetical protein
MSSLFKKPKKPKVIDPNKAEKEAERQKSAMAERIRQQRGYESTITTSGMGVSAPAPTQSKYLMGI